MRGERVGPQHQAATEQIFGDPRVGETMGGVMTPEKVAAKLDHADPGGSTTASATGCSSKWRPASRPAAAGCAKEFDGTPEVEVGWTT